MKENILLLKYYINVSQIQLIGGPTQFDYIFADFLPTESVKNRLLVYKS